jgi:hypothetical protein
MLALIIAACLICAIAMIAAAWKRPVAVIEKPTVVTMPPPGVLKKQSDRWAKRVRDFESGQFTDVSISDIDHARYLAEAYEDAEKGTHDDISK